MTRTDFLRAEAGRLRQRAHRASALNLHDSARSYEARAVELDERATAIEALQAYDDRNRMLDTLLVTGGVAIPTHPSAEEDFTP